MATKPISLLDQIELTRKMQTGPTKAQEVIAQSTKTGDVPIAQAPATEPQGGPQEDSGGQYTVDEIGKRLRAKSPQAFTGFTDKQIGERAIQKKPELGKMVAPPKPEEKNIIQQIAQPLTDMAATGVRVAQSVPGLVKGLGQTVLGDREGGARSIMEAGRDVEKPVNIPFLGEGNIRKIGTVNEQGDIVPSGETVKSLGTAAELASFAVPGAKIAKGTTILPRVAIRGAEGVLTGMLSEGGRVARETGDLAQVPGAGLKGGLLGGAFGVGIGAAGRGADLAGDQIARAKNAIKPFVEKTVTQIKGKFNSPALAARAVNSAIKPSKRAFSFSKNPGATVAKYKIIGNDIDDLAKNIAAAQNMVGTKIDDALSVPEAMAKKLDLTDTLSPIDASIKKAVETGDDTVYKQLNRAKERILKIFVEKDGQLVPEGARNLVNVNPKQATELKRLVGEMVKWTERSTDEEIVNGALYSVYGNIKRKVEQAVPTIKELNSDYSGLLEASKAATERSAVLQRQNLLGLDTGVKGLGGALFGLLASGGGAAPAVATGMTVAGINNAMKQPAVLTRVAAWLSSTTPPQAQKIFQKVPALKISIMNNAYLRNLLTKMMAQTVSGE